MTIAYAIGMRKQIVDTIENILCTVVMYKLNLELLSGIGKQPHKITDALINFTADCGVTFIVL